MHHGVFLGDGDPVRPGRVLLGPDHPELLQLDHPPGPQRPGRVGTALLGDPLPERIPAHPAPVLRRDDRVRHPQHGVPGLAQPPPGRLDPTPPVRPFRIDDPQPHELGQHRRIAVLTEPQHPGRRPAQRHRNGLPLSLGISGANMHDSLGLQPLVRGIPPIRSRRDPRRRRPERLHADKGYDYDHLRRWLGTRGIRHRIARKGIESSQRLGRHRWLVERTVSWMAGCRRLHRRYEHKAEHFLASNARSPPPDWKGLSGVHTAGVTSRQRRDLRRGRLTRAHRHRAARHGHDAESGHRPHAPSRLDQHRRRNRPLPVTPRARNRPLDLTA
ncbi:Transposase DDE domain protein [Streptomyces sp. ADI95-17]|nr:Transposase DDE domain protein [Streptomyces sp. ADI95-17]